MKNFGDALQSPTPCPGGADRPDNKPVRRAAPAGRDLLARLLDTPQLAQVVPQLQPALLHRVIQHFGLEDCSEIVALATPEQLAEIFDLDLWRAAQPGVDEQFDADRFGAWIEVLLEAGAVVAAQKLAALDADLVMTGLAQHTLVYDRAAVTPYETLEGELVTFYADAISVFDNGLRFETGAYLLVAKRADSWEAIVEVLTALDAGHPDYFHRVMRGCVTLSNSGFEDDGLDELLFDRDQIMFDQATNREERREQQGYVAPAQARAFLQMSRELRLDGDAAPAVNPLAQAYFRGVNQANPANGNCAANAAGLLAAASDAQPVSEHSAASVAVVYELFLDAGIVSPPPTALLSKAEENMPHLNAIKTRLEFARNHDYAAYLVRQEELVYLANVLMAGCSLQSRSFTTQEASDAAIAICNLGLENWPPHWLATNAMTPPVSFLPGSFLIDHDFVSVFQIGWKTLYDDVGMYAAKQLIEILQDLRCDDREIQMDLDKLRSELAKHWRAGTPWHTREALDVIAILDTPAWAALLTLIDECPRLHAIVAASRDAQTFSVRADDCEFIGENSQIASIRAFMRSLPETLGG